MDAESSPLIGSANLMVPMLGPKNWTMVKPIKNGK